jgi:hypothetical protein
MLWGKNATRELQYWQSVEASGTYSLAIGSRPRATGDYSIALGKRGWICILQRGAQEGKLLVPTNQDTDVRSLIPDLSNNRECGIRL